GAGRGEGLGPRRDLSSGGVRPPRRRPRRRDGHAAHGDRRGRRLRRRRPLHGRRRPRGRRRPGVRALRDGAPVSDGLVVKLLSLVVFVACSALFTGAEAAYFSLGRARLKRVAAQGAEGGGVKPLIERPHELLVTLLVAITVINIAAAALAALIADQLFGQRYALVIQVLVTILILTTFGEVLPMTLAVKYPERRVCPVGRRRRYPVARFPGWPRAMGHWRLSRQPPVSENPPAIVAACRGP